MNGIIFFAHNTNISSPQFQILIGIQQIYFSLDCFSQKHFDFEDNYTCHGQTGTEAHWGTGAMRSARLSPCLRHLLLHMSSAKCQIITCQLWITDTTIVKPTNTKSPFINPSLPTLTFGERTNQEKKINSMKY